MARNATETPNQVVSAKVYAALERAKSENYKLVAYLCEMALEELRLIDAEEYQKHAKKLTG